jgi:hypothetical protein
VKPRILFRASVAQDLPWFSQVTGYCPSPSFGGIVAQDERGELMGMVGFDSWAPNSVMMHFAIPRPRCLIPLWNEAVGYLAKWDRKVIFGATPSDNDRALRVIKKLGWTEIARLKDGWSDGVDIVISEFRIHGQKLTTSA